MHLHGSTHEPGCLLAIRLTFQMELTRLMKIDSFYTINAQTDRAVTE